MICFRCGDCCIGTGRIVVKPEYVSKNYNAKNPSVDSFLHIMDYKPCPHLQWESKTKAKCMIHHFNWYKYTPCYKHHQNYLDDYKLCTLGLYNILNNIDVSEHYRIAQKILKKRNTEIKRIIKLGITIEDFLKYPKFLRDKILYP